MTKEKRLGRGLEALLGRVGVRIDSAAAPRDEYPAGDDTVPAYPTAAESLTAFAESGASEPFAMAEPPTVQPYAPSPAPAPGPMQVAIGLIDSNPFQPRREFDEAEIDSLCESLQAHGLLQPVVVRRLGDHYQLVAGERRLRAAAKAGWADVPVHVVEADDRQTAELAIIENLQRKDLNALEKAASFQRYLDLYGCTQEELAGRLKLDRSTISNLIRLLELPEPVQDALRKGEITPGHARSLLPLGDEREQLDFCRRIREEGLSVRQTETLVQETISQADAEPLSVVGRDGTKRKARRITSEHVASLEQEFKTALGTKVKITHNARGRGKLVIQFAHHEEFERLREHICGRGSGKKAG